MTMGSVHHNYNLQCCFERKHTHTRSRNGHSLIENHQLQGQKYSTWAFHCAKYILYASNNLRKKTLQRDWHADYNYVPFNLICNILYFAGHNYEILPKHYNGHILKKSK